MAKNKVTKRQKDVSRLVREKKQICKDKVKSTNFYSKIERKGGK